MNLTHRNRVGFSRLGRLEHPPLRSPFPSGVLLTHTPDFVEELEAGVADIALAGHTHGGQVTLLGLYAPVTSSRYGTRFRTGLRHSSGGVPIVISGGLGTSRYPIRFCAPTDIVVITLRRKK